MATQWEHCKIAYMLNYCQLYSPMRVLHGVILATMLCQTSHQSLSVISICRGNLTWIIGRSICRIKQIVHALQTDFTYVKRAFPVDRGGSQGQLRYFRGNFMQPSLSPCTPWEKVLIRQVFLHGADGL